MAFNIEAFKTNGLELGGARPSLFEIFITTPFQDTIFDNKQRFLVKASTVPPSIIQPIEIGYFGRKVRYAGDREFANWAVTVLNDEDYAIRKGFERWHSKINSIVPNLMAGGRNFAQINNALVNNRNTLGYKMDAEVRHYGKRGNILAVYKLIGLFPTNINQMPLDWDAINQVQQFDVEFAFDYWVPAGGATLEQGIELDFFVPQNLNIAG